MRPRPSKNCRVFLDGEHVPEGNLTYIGQSPETACYATLDGKVVKPVAVVHDEDSGEIDEIYLEEVWE